jgi:hypothetical protein
MRNDIIVYRLHHSFTHSLLTLSHRADIVLARHGPISTHDGRRSRRSGPIQDPEQGRPMLWAQLARHLVVEATGKDETEKALELIEPLGGVGQRGSTLQIGVEAHVMVRARSMCLAFARV